MNSYAADAWRQAFMCVSSDWEMYEPESPLEEAVRSAYHGIEAIGKNEETVAAVIEAAALSWQSWEPSAFLDMARAFMCAYADMDMVKDQYIHENYPGAEPEWFKDDAPVWDCMVPEDELVVEANGAVYFFAKPGYARYESLIKG